MAAQLVPFPLPPSPTQRPADRRPGRVVERDDAARRGGIYVPTGIGSPDGGPPASDVPAPRLAAISAMRPRTVGAHVIQLRPRAAALPSAEDLPPCA